MATIEVRNIKVAADRLSRMTSDGFVEDAMDKAIKRIKKDLVRALSSEPVKPGSMPDECTGNVHIFALAADRCKCGAIEENNE